MKKGIRYCTALVPSLSLTVGGINPCFAGKKEESPGK